MVTATQVLFWSAVAFYLAVLGNIPVLAAPAVWFGFPALIKILFGETIANKLFDAINLHRGHPRYDPNQRGKVVSYLEKNGIAPERAAKMYEDAIIETGLLILFYNRIKFRLEPSQ